MPLPFVMSFSDCCAITKEKTRPTSAEIQVFGGPEFAGRYRANIEGNEEQDSAIREVDCSCVPVPISTTGGAYGRNDCCVQGPMTDGHGR
jgi:hypothetical protein